MKSSYYDEESLNKIMLDDVFPNISEYFYTLPTHIVLANLQKINSNSCNKNCILSSNHEGILLAFFSPFEKGKISDYHFLKFKDMQGVAIKSGIFNIKIIIQFRSGTRYTISVGKKDTSSLPNQLENLEYIISILKSKNLNDMKNYKYTEKKDTDKKLSFAYTSTLILCLLIPFCLFNTIKSKFIFAIILIFIGVVHFFAFILIGIILENLKNKKFIEEYNKILEKYNEFNDDYSLYSDLRKISNQPLTTATKNSYYLSLATAAIKVGHKNEAFDYLNMVQYVEGDSTNKIVNQKKEEFKNYYSDNEN